MANGRLGAVLLPSDTYTVVYTVPSGMRAAVNVSALSKAGSAQTVDLYLALEGSATTGPRIASHIAYNVSLANLAVLERTAIIMGAGESIVAKCSVTGSSVACQVWGFEESAS